MGINNLICQLIAIQNYCKDIHYNCKGDAFYSKHLLADRVQENISEYIDIIKEVFFLPEFKEPLSSAEYLRKAAAIIPPIEDDRTNFTSLATLLTTALQEIEELKGLTVGEENLIGTIAQDLQNNLGLVNMQFKD